MGILNFFYIFYFINVETYNHKLNEIMYKVESSLSRKNVLLDLFK